MKVKLCKRILASVFALGLTLSMLPSTAFAAPDDEVSVQADGDANVEGLNMDKTVTLGNDGTYTINLEAYATGEVTITEEKVPLDIVLVVDQSGSMADPFTYTEDQVRHVQFDGSYSQAYSSEVYHVCADGTYKVLNVTREWVWNKGGYNYTFSCSELNCPFGSHSNQCVGAGWLQGPNYWTILGGVEWGDQLFQRVVDSEETTRVLALQATLRNFVSQVETDASENNLNHKIAIVGFGSASGYGNNSEILTVEGNNTSIDNDNSLGVAYYDLDENDYLSALVDCNAGIVDNAINALATNGATRTDLGMEMAKKILDTETDETRKKVVIMFTDGVPTSSNTFDSGVAAGAIEFAYDMKNTDTDIYTVGIFDDADASTLIAGISGNSESANANRFMHATSSNYPDATTWGSYGSPAATNYYMTAGDADQLNEVFDSIAQSVTGSTSVTLTDAAVMRDILEEGFILPGGIEANPSQYVTVQTAHWNGTNFEAPGPVSGLTVTANEANNTVSVTGFSYKDHYCVEGIAGGEKLIVTIRGIQATEDAVTGSPVYTNAIGSGISEGNVLVPFDRPQVTIAKQSYVMDYAKTATINVNGITVSGLDKASDETLNGSANWTDSVKENYGVMTKSGSTLSYTPSTMQWDGYDSFYAFGKDSGNNNAWTKLSVIPANNVYYEDTFITDTETDAVVGIEYSGDWETVGTPANNAGEVDGTNVDDNNHGWITSMNDDKTYSDGSAHYTDLEKGAATATFTFTGKGVDVYSRTNMQTGIVLAELYKGEGTENTMNLSQFLVVDNYAQSGGAEGYYQIPTVSFTDLDYGTYTVKLMVQPAGTGENARSTYYLDGIRVYNPLAESKEADQTVSEAYGDEAGAVFTEVRDFLLTLDELGKVDADATIDGVVFLDQTSDGAEGNTSTVGEYYEYGPKNEVYLEPGQHVMFVIYGADKFSVGLKAPAGDTRAAVVNGSLEDESLLGYDINTAADLYYEITPYTETGADGSQTSYVYIRNDGPNLLSITKIKTSAEVEFASVSLADVISYANTFAALPVVDYTDEAIDGEQPGTVEPSEPSAPEEGDVVIDNPEETPDDSVQDDAGQQENPITSWFDKLISGIRNLFGRW